MIRKLFLQFILVFTCLPIFSQNWIWSRYFPSASSDRVWNIGIDQSQNMYVSGNINADINIGAPSVLTKLGPSADAYIAKYSSTGTYLWHKQIVSSGKIQRGMVAVDNNDSLVFTAFYQGIVDSLPSVPGSYISNKFDVLLAKYGPDGKLAWAKRVAWGPADIKSQDITTDPSGNIYIAAATTDTVYFDNGSSITSSGGKVMSFIAKYTPQGAFIFAGQINHSSTVANKNKLIEISVPNQNEIYTCGFFTDTVNAGSYQLSTGSNENALLVKFDGTGTVQWARMAGSPTLADRANGVSTDIYGNVYITGYVSGTAVFDSTGNGSQDASPVTSKGGYDIMVAKYNKNGTLLWKKLNGDTGQDIGYGAFISENIVVFSGYFSGTVTFNNTVLNSGSTSNENTGFFVYNTDGKAITAKDIPGNSLTTDACESITYDNFGNAYLGGYSASTDLTIGDSIFNTGGTQDGFVAVYHNPFSATFSQVKNVSCNSGNDGKLVVTTYFGKGPYLYQWSANVTNHTDSLASNLAAGNYSVTVTDSRDSIAITSTTITEAPALATSFLKTDLTCYQSGDGTINLTPSGGTPGYTYNWTGASGFNPITQNQSGLAAGWFKVTVTDANSCTKKDSIQVNEPAKILFGNSVVTPAIPPGSSTGKIVAGVSGGTPSYSYAWAEAGVIMSGETTDSIINLLGDTYQLSITDSHSCLADTSFVVPDQSLLQINKYTTPVTCYGLSNGSAAVTIVNKDPAATYSYAWSNSGIDTVISNVPAAKYYITITETGGSNRLLVDSLTVTQPAVLNISSIVPDTIACYGNSNGVISVTMSGGTPNYIYNWSNGASTESISQLPIGKYVLTVTDAHGCTDKDSATVIQNNPLVTNISVTQSITCNGYMNGRLTANVSGGQPVYSYLWDDPGSQTYSSATNLKAGLYSVMVTDSKGCHDTASYNLTEPAPITFSSIDTSDVTCYSLSDGYIAVKVAGGTAPYTYTWNPAAGTTDSISDLPSFNYKLTVTDNTGICKNTSFSYMVKKPVTALGIAEVTGSHVDNLCYGSSSGKLEVVAAGGWGNYEYSIDNTNWVTSPTFSSLASASYIVRVRDGGGCKQNVISDITSPAEIVVNSSFTVGNSILVSASGGSGTLTYTLDNGTPQSSGQFNNVTNGNHSVSVTDGNSCGPVVVNNIVINTSIKNPLYKTINIYPNPSSGLFHFKLENYANDQIRVQVYSITGFQVADKTFDANPAADNSFSIDLRGSASGIYILKINGLVLDQKLIIQ